MLSTYAAATLIATGFTPKVVSNLRADSIHLNGLAHEIDCQTIVPQQASPHENLRAQNKGCFCLNDLPVKWEINQVRVFFDGLATSQCRSDPPNIPTV